MDKRVIAAMGVAAALFALVMVFLGRPSTEPVETTPVTVSERPKPRTSAAVAPRPEPAPHDPLVVTHARPLGEPGEAGPGRPAGGPDFQPHAEAPVVDEAQQEARREYRCRTLEEQSDLMDRLIVVGGARTLEPEQRLKMASRVATLGTRVFEEDENIRAGLLDCGDGGSTNMTGASDFLVRARDELGDLLDADGHEELEQAIALFDSAPEP